MVWYNKALKSYTKFDGRARRREFWTFAMINFAIYILLAVGEGMINLTYLFSSIFVLAVLLPSIAVCVRRLHDTGKSGWWLLLACLPVLGAIVLIVFFVEEGHAEPNKYGPNPKAAEGLTI